MNKTKITHSHTVTLLIPDFTCISSFSPLSFPIFVLRSCFRYVIKYLALTREVKKKGIKHERKSCEHLRTVLKRRVKKKEEAEIWERLKAIRMPALLKSNKILTRVLECSGDLLDPQ